MKTTFTLILGSFLFLIPGMASANTSLRPAPLYQAIAKTGEVLIQNQSGVRQNLVIDRVSYGIFSAGESRSIRLDEGAHKISWSELGGGGTQSQVIQVRARQIQSFRLPALAQLTLRNPFNRSVTVKINGVLVGSLRARESKTFSKLQPGVVNVSMMDGRRTLHSERTRLREGRNQLVVAQSVRPPSKPSHGGRQASQARRSSRR